MIKASRRTLIIILVAIVIVWICYGGFRFIYKFSGRSDSYSLPSSSDIELTIKVGMADIFISPSKTNDVLIESERAGGIDVIENGNIITINLNDRRFLADGYLNVEIPMGIKSLAIETDTGDIDVASIDVSNVFFKAGTGDISITNITSKDLSAESNIGEVNINDSKIENNIKAILGTGDLTIESVHSNTIEAKLSTGDFSYGGGSFNFLIANTTTGDIDISLEDENGEISYSVGEFGDVYIFGNRYQEKENTLTFGNGVPKLELSSNIGEINITSF